MRPILPLALLLLAMAISSMVAADPSTVLQTKLGLSGLASLRFGPQELLSSGDFKVENVLFQRFDGVAADRKLGESTLRVDKRAHRYTRSFDWGEVSCAYVLDKNRLDIDIAISNRSPDVLSGILLQVLSLKFPGGVQSFEDGVRSGSNVDTPTVIGADCGICSIALANSDVGRPLYLGMPTGDLKKPDAQFPIVAATYRDDVFPRSWLGAPRISRPIYPGETDHLSISLWLGPKTGAPDDLAADIYNRYAAAYPATFTWKDRRPVGYLMLSSTVPHPATGTSPRGWFYNDPKVDTTTPEGRVRFGKQLLDYADTSIANLKLMNAQGVIVWDVEGQEYPHAMSYIGDPRHLPSEIEPYIDAFFKKLRDAGFRVGVCIRPQLPLKTVYGDVADQVQVSDIAAHLEQKIDYARKRWGCTMFYVDSNVHFDIGGNPSDEKAYELLPASIFQQIFAANPDCFFIPEQKALRYWAYGVPYQELRNGPCQTPDSVRRVYPDAFSIINTSADNNQAPVFTRRQDVINAVKSGDILIFRAWFTTPEMEQVKEIYQAAGKPLQ